MADKTSKRAADSATTLHQFMMPEHANPAGTVHGGLIMKMVDEAGAICAMRHAQRPVVTIAVDSMTFKSPVAVGQVLTLQANITYVGRTSMEIEVTVMAEDPIGQTITHTNSAYLVYVALDEQHRPAQVPRLITETDAARAAFEAGRKRQAHRLAQQRS